MLRLCGVHELRPINSNNTLSITRTFIALCPFMHESLRTVDGMSAGGQRTRSTEQLARCTIPSETLPSKKRSSPFRPWELTTMRSWFFPTSHTVVTKSRSCIARRARGAERLRGVLEQYVEGASSEPAAEGSSQPRIRDCSRSTHELCGSIRGWFFQRPDLRDLRDNSACLFFSHVLLQDTCPGCRTDSRDSGIR